MRLSQAAIAVLTLVGGLFVATAKGDLMLHLPDNNPAFELDAAYGYITGSTGPDYSLLPPVPHIHGLKISGSATYTSFRASSQQNPREAVLALNTSGLASGSNYLPDFLYIDYDINFVRSRAIPFRFTLSAVFHYVEDDMLTQALGVKGYELRFGMKNTYDYVCPGYKQDANSQPVAVWDATQSIDNNAQAFGEL